ncbi:MAG: Fic family protein [Lachnospiraceae bacterium]|jgi:prophage maintenance system killer protein|nr:Fic family protein [Lachnospiraceae bacterium]
MYYKNKYELSKKEELYVLRQDLVALIYNTGKFEVLNTTFFQIQEIVKYGRANGVSVDDVITIVNLKKGFELIGTDYSSYYQFMLDVNKLVAAEDALIPGEIRTGDTQVSLIANETYIPAIPKIKEVIECFANIERESITTTEKALEVLLYITKVQLLWDGNKRTALIIANKVLFDGNNGVLNISEDYFEEFNRKLSDYYQDEDKKEEIKQFMYDNCIFGINYKNK